MALDFHTETWWSEFQQCAEILNRLSHQQDWVQDYLPPAKRLFTLYRMDRKAFGSFSKEELQGLVAKVVGLLDHIQRRSDEVANEQAKKFYRRFGSILEVGLREVEVKYKSENIATKQISYESPEALGGILLTHEERYLTLLQKEAAHDPTGHLISERTEALQRFLKIANSHLRHRYALDYAIRALQENLNHETLRPRGSHPPFRFRVLTGNQPHHYKIAIASDSQISKLDQSILDTIEDCDEFLESKITLTQLMMPNEAKNFFEFHGKREQLKPDFVFYNDSLSAVAEKLFSAYHSILTPFPALLQEVLNLLNRTPLGDLEFLLHGIEAESCRQVLQFKFRSLLPGLNEDRQRANKTSRATGRSLMTVKLMNQNRAEFERRFQEITKDLRSSIAFRYWLRKTIAALLEKNSHRDAGNPSKVVAEPGLLEVGVSITLGDADPEQYGIGPELIRSPSASSQHARKKEGWMNISTSEKCLLLPTGDFFQVLNDLYQRNLNPAMQRFHLAEVDLANQLLPEMRKRVDDIRRVESIASGILGACYQNLDEFCKNLRFHRTFLKYFAISEYDAIHYPFRERVVQVANALSQANQTVAQIKYRKVLKLFRELSDRIENLRGVLNRKPPHPKSAELLAQLQSYQGILLILERTLLILEFAKPALATIRNEPITNS